MASFNELKLLHTKKVYICIYRLLIILWQGLLSLNGTLEEWVKRSDAEFAATEAEIREIRELLDEDQV